MKRINPETGLPFRRGDLRADGYVFMTYQKTVVRADGTFKELWLHPDKVGAAKRRTSAAGVVCQRNRRRKHGAIINRYKTWKGCAVCGYNKHPSALDLDHRDRSTKLFDISSRVASKPWEVIAAEIRQCDVLCANCHRIKTYEEQEWKAPLNGATGCGRKQ